MYRFFLAAFLSIYSIFLFAQPPASSPKLKNQSIAAHVPPFFNRFGKELNEGIPSLGAFLVWHHHTLIYERYFHGAEPQTAFNIKSITKTMVSALAGIAEQKGLLPGLDTPVLSLLPEYAKPNRSSSHVWFGDDKAINDSIRATLTLKHLLTMQAGFDWDDFGPLASAMISSSDPVRFTFDIPFDGYPGETFNYNTGASIIFGAALAKSVQTDLRAFADSNLFQPAGIKLLQWDTDPLGRYIGGSEMYMTAQDLMRFGLLFLHYGVVDDKQVIPAAWVKESTAAHAKLNSWPVLPGANGYGYYWWRRKSNGHQAYVASGYGGQLICIVPDLDMVIVTTCYLNQKNRGREEIKRLHNFIDQLTKASFKSPH